MISLKKERIPPGNWPFLLTIAASLREMEAELVSECDLTEGTGSVLVTGEMAAYRQAMMRRALDLAGGSIACWNEGIHVGAVACSRALLETIATYHWFLTEVQDAVAQADWGAVSSIVIGCGRSTSIPSQRKSTKSYRVPPRIGSVVKGFIEKTNADAIPFWDQICNFAHPNGGPTMDHFGETVGTTYVMNSGRSKEPNLFIAVYNSLYACCWLQASGLDFDVAVEEMRLGTHLPSNHPLIQRRLLVDQLTSTLCRSEMVEGSFPPP